MDEAQSLDVLTKLLEQLSEDAYNISLHAQHLRLAQSTPALASQVIPACEMFTAYLAAGEDVWTPLLDAKHAALDMNSPSAEVLEELLGLYDSAEEDYLCASFRQFLEDPRTNPVNSYSPSRKAS